MRPIPHLLCWSVGLARPETQTTDRERQALATCAAGRSRVVELGVWHGVTTAVLRRAMAPDGVLWAVDPFPAGRLGFSPQRPIAKRSVGRVPNGTVVWVRETGARAGALYRERGLAPVEMLFIDADHSYQAVMDDWIAWSPLMAIGGIVCFHDSAATDYLVASESIRAVDEIVRTSPAFERIDVVDTLTAIRRRR